MVKAIPDGYHSLTPYLVIKGAQDAITFYQQAFNATLLLCLDMPDGSVAHAEMRVGNSSFMFSEESIEMGFTSPQTLGGSCVTLMVYTEDVDVFFQQAIAAGCEAIRPVENQFYGDRAGTLKDPFGHIWTIATHVEDVSEEELNKRLADMLSS